MATTYKLLQCDYQKYTADEGTHYWTFFCHLLIWQVLSSKRFKDFSLTTSTCPCCHLPFSPVCSISLFIHQCVQFFWIPDHKLGARSNTMHCNLHSLQLVWLCFPFCNVLLTNTATVKVTLPLSVYSPLLLLFIQVNDFIQLSDFVRTQRQGLSWALRKGRMRKRKKIKAREAEKRFIRAQAPNVLALCKAMTHRLALYMNAWVAKTQPGGCLKWRWKYLWNNCWNQNVWTSGSHF